MNRTILIQGTSSETYDDDDDDIDVDDNDEEMMFKSISNSNNYKLYE